MVDWKQLDVLKSELAAELEEIGYLPPEKLDAALVMQSDRQKQHEAIRFQGELRYHYAANDGASRFRDDSRLRTRLYLDADLSQFADYLDDSWRAYTMFEYEYSLKAHRETRRLFERPRFYIEGMTGVTELTLGRYGYMLAEGNVYDTSFTGINAEVQVANATYRAGYGQSDLISRGYILEADVDCFDYSYGAGLYALYDNDEVRNTIMMAKGAYLFDDYRVGVMYLHSSHDSAEQRGYVVFA